MLNKHRAILNEGRVVYRLLKYVIMTIRMIGRIIVHVVNFERLFG